MTVAENMTAVSFENSRKLHVGEGLFKAILYAAALIILMVVWLAQGKPTAVPLQASDVIPPYNGIASLVLIIGTFIAFAGLEVNEPNGVVPLIQHQQGGRKGLQSEGGSSDQGEHVVITTCNNQLVPTERRI